MRCWFTWKISKMSRLRIWNTENCTPAARPWPLRNNFSCCSPACSSPRLYRIAIRAADSQQHTRGGCGCNTCGSLPVYIIQGIKCMPSCCLLVHDYCYSNGFGLLFGVNPCSRCASCRSTRWHCCRWQWPTGKPFTLTFWPCWRFIVSAVLLCTRERRSADRAWGAYSGQGIDLHPLLPTWSG